MENNKQTPFFFLSQMAANAKGFVASIEKMANDPTATPEQKKEMEEAIKKSGLRESLKNMDECEQKLKEKLNENNAQ